MELLLVTQQEISAGEASRALGTFEGLFLGVRPLVSFQVLQSGKGALAGCADVRARLVGFRRREIGRCLGVDGDRGSCGQLSVSSCSVGAESAMAAGRRWASQLGTGGAAAFIPESSAAAGVLVTAAAGAVELDMMDDFSTLASLSFMTMAFEGRAVGRRWVWKNELLVGEGEEAARWGKKPAGRRRVSGGGRGREGAFW
jgi:hypothetical protein